MNPKLHTSLLLTSIMASLTCLCFVSRAASPLSVAVLDFESPEAKLKDTGAQLSLLLNTRLSASQDLWMVERQQLDAVLGEQQLGASGMVDPSTAARIGHLTGAKVLITGRVFSIGRDTMIAAKVIGTETSRVFGHSVKLSPGGALDKAADELAAALEKVIQDQTASLVAPVEDEENLIKTLRSHLGDHALPSIKISIPEHHISRPVIDPAAQTEIANLLGQLGAHLLATESSDVPDIQIHGEAFSELALRRGGLISVRARVEIEVVETKTGHVLLADRQTEVAVDPSESIAAKTALQHAGAALSERILSAIISPAH